MGNGDSLRYCKAYLRRRLEHSPPGVERDIGGGEHGSSSGWGHSWPLGRHEQCEELRRVLRRTVFEHESQSALLLGYAGTGKSLVLDRVLRSLAQEALPDARPADGGGGGKRKRQQRESASTEAGGREGEGGTGGPAAPGEENVSPLENGGGGGGGGVSGSLPPSSLQPQQLQQHGQEEQSPLPQQQQQQQGVRRQKRQQRRKLKQPFRAVYLNGAAQANDVVAMREIVQQLGITGAATQGSVYNSNLAMMVESMKMGSVNGVPVIFVLDEFERFTCRKPQTLLYALLDLCQDKTICAAVVGLSVNLNVLDVAEKRVKSRFSFRQIRFPRQDLEAIVSILADALTVPGGTGDDGRRTSDNNNNNNDDDGDGDGNVGDTVSADSSPPAGVSAAFAREFNAVTLQTLAAKSRTPTTASSGGSGGSGSGSGSGRSSGSGSGRGSGASTAPPSASASASASADLKELAASGRSVGWFLRLAGVAVGLLQDDERGLTRRAVVRAGEMLAADAHADALRMLSVTQALVLVAMVRLERRGRRRDGCSFEAVFREYGSYLRTFSACHLRFSRAVILKAFGQLAEQGALRSAEPGTGGGREAHPLLHCRFRSRFDLDQVHQALEKCVISAPTNVTQWCKRWQKQ